MGSPNKQKGTRFESAVRDYLIAADIPGWSPRRVAQTGRADSGDLHGVGPWCLQAKAWKDLTAALREGVDGAVRQAIVAGLPLPAAVIKRPRRPIGDAYVVMPLSVFAELNRNYLKETTE